MEMEENLRNFSYWKNKNIGTKLLFLICPDAILNHMEANLRKLLGR